MPKRPTVISPCPGEDACIIHEEPYEFRAPLARVMGFLTDFASYETNLVTLAAKVLQQHPKINPAWWSVAYETRAGIFSFKYELELELKDDGTKLTWSTTAARFPIKAISGSWHLSEKRTDRDEFITTAKYWNKIKVSTFIFPKPLQERVVEEAQKQAERMRKLIEKGPED